MRCFKHPTLGPSCLGVVIFALGVLNISCGQNELFGLGTGWHDMLPHHTYERITHLISPPRRVTEHCGQRFSGIVIRDAIFAGAILRVVIVRRQYAIASNSGD